MYSPDKIKKGRISGEDSPTEKQAKREMIEAFDEMPNETDPQVLDALWQRVDNGERLLKRELHRKVREYEAWAKGQHTTQ